MSVILETHNLTKKYKKDKVIACNNINMKIEQGDIYGFVGRNGAGKTSLIRLITGLSKPTSGSFSLFGISNNENLPTALKRCSGIVETPSIFYNLNAYDNLLYQAKLRGITDSDVIVDILKRVGLDPNLKRKVRRFSLGMRQRLSIAICLIGNPDFILLDEPMNGLDPQGIIEIRELLLDLNKQGITILISSHILSELSKIATKYGFIEDGKIIEEITVEELEKKCKRYIEFSFDINALDKVNYVLRDMNHNITNNKAFVYENIDCTPFMNLLTNNDIYVTELKYVDMDVEKYFINLVGGLK